MNHVWPIAVAQLGAVEGAEDPELAQSVALLAGSAALLGFLVVVLLVKVGYVALSLWFGARYPAYGARVFDQYRSRPGRCCLVGAVNIGAGVILALLMIASQVLFLLGVLLLLAMGVVSVFAYGAAYRSLGQHLMPDTTPPKAFPVRQQLLGGIAAEAAFCMPIVGQILSLLVLVRGFGASVLALLAAPRRASVASMEAPSPIPGGVTGEE